MTLTYTVNEPATCSPPSGTIVNLSVGVNTIFVTCTDAEGAVGTASVVVTRPDALPQCARDVVITNVQRSGSQSRISGIARLRYAGQRVNLQYEAEWQPNDRPPCCSGRRELARHRAPSE